VQSLVTFAVPSKDRRLFGWYDAKKQNHEAALVVLVLHPKKGIEMTRVRVEGFTISLDGYGAGPNQDLGNPLGVGGTDLHQWLFPTRTLQRNLFGNDGGTTGIDDDFAARGFQNVGAWILGRNMFGPVRGAWPDMHWKGWWGDNPPYHVPTFILTHHAREPIQMEGGTTFHFVTGGIHEALERAREAAQGADVRIGGGAHTIGQYLRAGLIDEMHFAISPVLLGAGEWLFEGVDVRALGYECVQFVASEKATHVLLRRR
jgi:dihydrofolate reductase